MNKESLSTYAEHAQLIWAQGKLLFLVDGTILHSWLWNWRNRNGICASADNFQLFTSGNDGATFALIQQEPRLWHLLLIRRHTNVDTVHTIVQASTPLPEMRTVHLPDTWVQHDGLPRCSQEAECEVVLDVFGEARDFCLHQHCSSWSWKGEWWPFSKHQPNIDVTCCVTHQDRTFGIRSGTLVPIQGEIQSDLVF